MIVLDWLKQVMNNAAGFKIALKLTAKHLLRRSKSNTSIISIGNFSSIKSMALIAVLAVEKYCS